jgi:hypothetical protein
LKVLRSVASPSELVKESIDEKAKALALHKKEYVPAAEAEVKAFTAKSALFLGLVKKLHAQLR